VRSEAPTPGVPTAKQSRAAKDRHECVPSKRSSDTPWPRVAGPSKRRDACSPRYDPVDDPKEAFLLALHSEAPKDSG